MLVFIPGHISVKGVKNQLLIGVEDTDDKIKMIWYTICENKCANILNLI